MSSNDESHPSTSIDTGGGALIGGDVNTGGDFVGRDKVTITEETAYTVYGLENPYLGLRAFRYEDSAIYAGREKLAQETVQRLTTPGAQQTIIFITGASGSGKSSFVQAALIPLLEIHYAAYHKTVRHAIFRPSSQPLAMLADALQKLHPDLTPETLATHTPKDQINLLLIDQFEELFIQSDASQRAPFCDFLINLPNFATSRTHILITLRVDYLDELFAIQPLWAIAKEGVELRIMSADDLRHAIQKPLHVYHPQKRFAPELLDRLVQDAGKDAALLPLLQVTLAELWKAGKLVLSNYHSLTDAIRQRAEMVYAFSDHAGATPKIPRSAHDQQEFMGILLDLINVSVDGDARRDVRQRRTRQELTQGSAQRLRLIEELVNARLLAAAIETRNGVDVEVIDIIHESLIDNWDRLRNAIEEQRQQLQRRARFKLWLGEWLRNGRQDGYLLLTDMQLAEAQALVEARDIEVQRAEAKEFYRRSVEWREAERQKELQRAKELAEAQRQRAQVFRNGVIAASLLFLLAAAAAGVSYTLNGRLNQTNEQLQQTITETQRLASVSFSRQLAAQSTIERSKDNDELALLLAIESGKAAATVESFVALRAAVAYPGHSRAIFYHTDFVHQLQWSKDGSKFLASTENGTIHLWDVTEQKLIAQFEGDRARIVQMFWSSNEARILTLSQDGAVKLWSTADPKHPLQLPTLALQIRQIRWNKNESKIVTSSNDGTIRIWDATSGRQLAQTVEQSGMILQLSWNADESEVLTSSDSGIAALWDAKTGEKLVSFPGGYYADWNADKSQILTYGGDASGAIRIWDAKTHELVHQLDNMGGAFWSPDGSKLLTITLDKPIATIRDAGTFTELAKLRDFPEHTTWAQWSPTGDYVFTDSSDNAKYLWNLDTGTKLQLSDSADMIMDYIEWNKDESKILINTGGGSAGIWETTTGEVLFKLKAIQSIHLSPDEHDLLLSNADDTTVRIRSLTSGAESLSLENHQVGLVQDAIWNQDETKILTHNREGIVQTWDTITGAELNKLTGHTQRLTQVAWNKDESQLLTSSTDSTVRLWNLRAKESKKQEIIKLEEFTWAKWSPDYRKILTANVDNNTLTVWDVTNPKIPIATIKGHPTRTRTAVWSHNSQKILSSGFDEPTPNSCSTRIWNAMTGDELQIFPGCLSNQAKWSKQDDQILIVNSDDSMHIWNTDTGHESVGLQGINSAVWNRAETLLLVSHDDQLVHIWNVQGEAPQATVEFRGHSSRVVDAIWNEDETQVLTRSADHTIRIWDAASGTELVKLDIDASSIRDSVAWSAEGEKILTLTYHNNESAARVWDATTGNLLMELDETRSAIWSKDGQKLLIIDDEGKVRIIYVNMKELLSAACTLSVRNLTRREWQDHADRSYNPTCPNAPIPPDAIEGIQDEARQFIRNGQLDHATQRLTELNGWLQVSGQFKNYGVDVDAFVDEVAATTEARP